MSGIESQVEQLKAGMRGIVIGRGDPAYDEVRALYNGMIDKRPSLITQCRDVADVISAVNFARENQLEVAIRGGGHNGPGLGSVNDGLVIDLSPMKGVRVDPQAKTVRAQGGCTWADVDHATHAFGMATPSGIVSTTGVGGLTLGGGVGNITRQCGLTIDNLLEVDVVLADGRFLTANANQNEDLFWAVRGGGGNFGVVTSFLFKLHPVGTVYGGPIFYEMTDAPKVMRFWHDFIMDAPEDFNAYFGLHTVPPADMFPAEHHLKKMGVVICCYTGELSQGEAVLQPFRDIATPAIDFAGPIPFPMLQGLFDGLYPPGLQWYWNADFVIKLSDEAIALHLEHFAQSPTVHSAMHLYPTNGAAHQVGRNDTAWNYREANFAQVIVGVDPDPANQKAITNWSKAYWQALHPHSAGGAYVNMMMEEGEDRIRAAYGDNYMRLAQIKAKYDPHNLFHVNQNIKPAS
jgi:FAD/FMN-containing dehydrogenase